MENAKAKQVIDDFFKAKIEKSLSDSYKEIVSAAQKGKYKNEIEEISKLEDAIESNDWTKEKLDKLIELLRDSNEVNTEIIVSMTQALALCDENQDPITLKENLAKELDKTKKILQKSPIADELKDSCKKIFDEKLKKENASKNKRILDILAKNHPDIHEKLKNTESEINEKYEPNKWIGEAAAKASGASVGLTHVAKLTHSSAKASNISASAYKSESITPILVTTNCANKLPLDYACSTAGHLPVAEFLQLDCDGEILGKVICNDGSPLKYFATDDNQVEQWREQFGLAFNEKRKSTHELLKQVYFPVKTDYHLLTPLVSSSMAQIIDDRIWQTRQKDLPARNAKNAGIFFNQLDISFSKTAILKTTQTNHQNVSNLNGKRSGKIILLRSLPPQWQTQIQAPINIKTIFNRELSRQVKEPSEKLKNLLLAIKFNELSMNLQRKQLISELVSEIAVAVFDYVSQIQGLKHYAGWSQESKLPTHQRYWLDPYRTDEDFQISKTSIDWQADVLGDCAKWVNRQVKHPKLTLGVAHEKHWRKLFAPLLRESSAITDVALEEAVIETGENA
ncbi:MAG: type I-F CRISPR-associated protein Csy1 [Methylococcaceae bacterium]